ncbi:HNH endonuclease signature motif containing protein [Nitrosococcus wardiae]|uniref:HNH endonuclease n=1 Tax=Nitrosococcus wardiae TaxID=1814290 RepID=A0A4P7C045_9GAMM|nr:HNH endonuclease signature motif containing protein [Nitrosococcus wardiae]QBQ54929.1 HNH endonuclease [Nitrosococcus wardiae]
MLNEAQRQALARKKHWVGRNKMNTVPLINRFLEKTIRIETGCLMWIGAKNKNGYGCISVEGKTKTASRLAYELFIGPIPDGMIVCHRCDFPLCIEPNHLFLGTDTDNRRDCKKKGRANGARGERNVKAKLKEHDVIVIRSSSARSGVLANKYGVSRSTIKRIRSGKIWRHI